MLATHRFSLLGASGAAALALLLSLFAPADAQANPGCRFHSNCGRCGQAVYAYPILAGYDRCGNPVYQWAARPHTSCSVRHSRGTIYSNRHVYHHGFGGYCPPTVVVPRYYGPACPPSRGGVTFHFGF
jgi:hypothetical protein